MTVTKCYSGFTAKCVVEFYFDWLNELIDRRDNEGESICGHVVAGLYRLADARKLPLIADGQRPLPVSQSDNAGWPGLRHLDPQEFAASIALRLYDLERRERAPKVMPHACRIISITDDPEPPFWKPAICLKSSDDGHRFFTKPDQATLNTRVR